MLNMIFETKQELQNRIKELKFIKEMKKDYYKYFPSIKIYMEISELISQINYLECKVKNFI
jgi:hypothetical protein